MKITVYTIKDCTFSKQEKEYLTTNKLQYEEKDLETNKDFLTEMLAISNNFAGTPVTRVEKDDGAIAVFKGFTKGEFDTTFGLAPTQQPVPPPVAEPTVSPNQAVPPAPIATPVEIPVATTPDLSTVSTTEEASAKVDPLKSVMDDLQSKSQSTDQPIQPTTVSTNPSPIPPAPPIAMADQNPPAVNPTAPDIPDFPVK